MDWSSVIGLLVAIAGIVIGQTIDGGSILTLFQPAPFFIVLFGTMGAVILQSKPANLEAVDLFDVFRGKNVPAGQKSMAYALTYRSQDRTLTDAEVNAAHEKLAVQLKERLHATLRES